MLASELGDRLGPIFRKIYDNEYLFMDCFTPEYVYSYSIESLSFQSEYLIATFKPRGIRTEHLIRLTELETWLVDLDQ